MSNQQGHGTETRLQEMLRLQAEIKEREARLRHLSERMVAAGEARGVIAVTVKPEHQPFSAENGWQDYPEWPL